MFFRNSRIDRTAFKGEGKSASILIPVFLWFFLIYMRMLVLSNKLGKLQKKRDNFRRSIHRNAMRAIAPHARP